MTFISAIPPGWSIVCDLLSSLGKGQFQSLQLGFPYSDGSSSTSHQTKGRVVPIIKYVHSDYISRGGESDYWVGLWAQWAHGN